MYSTQKTTERNIHMRSNFSCQYAGSVSRQFLRMSSSSTSVHWKKFRDKYRSPSSIDSSTIPAITSPMNRTSPGRTSRTSVWASAHSNQEEEPLDRGHHNQAEDATKDTNPKTTSKKPAPRGSASVNNKALTANPTGPESFEDREALRELLR
jgi:hypothetical protein